MHSAAQTSLTRVPISVIVATSRPWPGLRMCLDSLHAQAQQIGAEVLVADCSGSALPDDHGLRYPEVTWRRPKTGAAVQSIVQIGHGKKSNIMQRQQVPLRSLQHRQQKRWGVHNVHLYPCASSRQNHLLENKANRTWPEAAGNRSKIRRQGAEKTPVFPIGKNCVFVLGIDARKVKDELLDVFINPARLCHQGGAVNSDSHCASARQRPLPAAFRIFLSSTIFSHIPHRYAGPLESYRRSSDRCHLGCGL
jgi:hypothetical protein